jgi:chromosome segregation ATPase
MEKNFKELYQARMLIEELQEKNQMLEEKNYNLEDRLKRLVSDMDTIEDQVRMLEEKLGEKDKENFELIEKFEDVVEENKQIKSQSHQLKERCNDYILSEEDYITKLNDKDVKIQKLYVEIEEGQKSITLFELQLKEFSKLVIQYKNEKESFQKRKEILNALQKSNHDKNEMLYYFNHKNHQLVVEKQKLDQYIKLCQYQIKKLTDEEKRLKHENHVLKALNENLMELGKEEGAGTVVVVQRTEGSGKPRKDNSKLVMLLKENIGVSYNFFVRVIFLVFVNW